MRNKLGWLQPEPVRTPPDLLAATIYPISQVFHVEDFQLKLLKSEFGNFSQSLTHVGWRKSIGVP
jgi:hypothetical protein